MVYPVPQKEEDFLDCKEKFITEYISFYQALSVLKDLFVSQSVLNNIGYIKNRYDKEQKRRLEAYKIWRKMTSHSR